MKLHEIDTLTIDKYYKITETKDYSLLIVGKKKPLKINNIRLEDHLHKINDDITQIIGENTAYNDYLVHKIKALEHQVAAANGQLHRLNFAKLEEGAAIKALGGNTKPQSLTEIILQLSKNQGLRYDKNITCEEYFTLLKMNKK